MKIAIIIRFPADPALPRGGVESVAVNLVSALGKLEDLDLHVVTTDRTVGSPLVSTWEGVTIHRLPWLGRSMLTHVTGPGRRLVRAYLATLRPDVIHSHGTYGLMVKGLKIPRVFTLHGLIYADTLLAGERFARLRSWLWRHAETAGWADQPHIISISPYTREQLRGIAADAIHDIANPVSEEFFQIQRNESKKIVFCAARISAAKNTLALLQGFRQLIAEGLDVELRLAGSPTKAGYYRRVEEFIEKEGLAGRVKLLGQLNPDSIRRELGSAAVFTLVSLQENAPMAIEEAMAAGVPVVTSNRCGMPYMVCDGESGYLVDPNDPEDIARRLRQLLMDDTLRAAMGKKSRQIAEDHFHADKVAWRTREVYFQAVSNH